MVKKLLKVEYLATYPQKSALQPSVPVPSTKSIASEEPYQSWAPWHKDQRMAPALSPASFQLLTGIDARRNSY